LEEGKRRKNGCRRKNYNVRKGRSERKGGIGAERGEVNLFTVNHINYIEDKPVLLAVDQIRVALQVVNSGHTPIGATCRPCWAKNLKIGL